MSRFQGSPALAERVLAGADRRAIGMGVGPAPNPAKPRTPACGRRPEPEATVK
jgi:hypothetical protein